MKALWVLALLAMSADMALAADTTPPIEVTVTASDLEVDVGDIIDVLVTVEHPAALRVAIPEDDAAWPGFAEIGRARQTIALKDGRARTEIELAVMALSLGETRLGPIPISYVEGGKLRTTPSPSLAVNILGVRAAGDTAMRDIAGPVPARRRASWPFFAAGLVAVAILAVAAYVAWRRRQRRARPAVPAVHPAEEALGRLAALEESGALDDGDRQHAFREMSAIVRGYLGGLYGFPARELTTGEVEAALACRDGASLAAELLGDWLAMCDLVKYAGHEPSPDDARQALYRARLLVERTRAAT